MKQNGKYNVLIITGIVTDGHDPRIVTMLRYMLESTGRFKVKITEEFRGATAETLEGYDVIIYDYDGKETIETPYVGLGEQAEKLIFDFVASGKGAVPFHSGILMGDPAFPEEFAKFVGIDLDLIKKDAQKSPKWGFRVDVKSNSDPITAGMRPDFYLQLEDLFVGGKLQDGVQVLATVENNKEDYNMELAQKHIADEFKNIDLDDVPGMGIPQPVIWKHNYGKGRVFSMFLGNSIMTIQNPTFTQLMCRGVEWAASGEVTLPVLDLEYEKRKTAWPFYNGMKGHDVALMKMF